MVNEKIILQVLSEQKEETQQMDTSKWCDRMEENQFELDSPLSQVVIGVRRSGKSTICHKVLLQNNIQYAYINLDDDRLLNLESSDLDTLLNCIYQLYGTNIKYILLDEIQNVEGWHLFVNRLQRIGMHIFVTGSNAHLLSSELATHLTGRYNEIRLFPFSFAEFCSYNHIDITSITTKADADRKIALNDYLINGGFPELMHIRNKRAYVQSLIETIITKDIKNRFHIRNIDALRLIANHLISNACQEINYEQLSNQFGIGSQTTTKKYVAYLSQAFLITQIHKFSFKSTIRLRDTKAYIVDTGLIANRSDALLPQNYGWRLEDIVCIELLRRCAPLFYDVYYYKPTSRSKEVDFVVCEQGHVKELIQVAYDIDTPKTFNREVSALIQAANTLHCNNLSLISLTETRTQPLHAHTLHIYSLIDWLLLPLTNQNTL